MRRNGTEKKGYRPIYAERKAKERRRESKEPYRKIDGDPDLQQKIERMLHPLISPEVVAHLCGIHHQRIYDRVRRERPDLKDRLPRKGRKKRKKTGKRTVWVSTTRSIHNRPETDGLSREGDTLVGPTKTRILTHVEKKSLYLDARVIRDGLSHTVHETLQKRPLQGQITYDCGSEFTLWKWIEEDTGATVYFCDPHSPGQRGKNENTNGRLRRVYPKNTDLSTIAQQNLNNIVHLMNNTPRKSLNWKTPAQVYTALVASQSRI